MCDLIWYPNTQQALRVSGSGPESQTLQPAARVSVCTTARSRLFKSGFHPGKVFFVLFFMLTSDIWFSNFWPLQLWIHQHVGVDAAVCRDAAVFCTLIQRHGLPCGELRFRTPHKSHQLSILSGPEALALMVSASADFCNTLSVTYLHIPSQCF